MPQLVIKTNAAECGRWLMGNSKKMLQAGKAALSQTVLQVQKAEQLELRKEFTIRKSGFMRNRVKIFRFPKATSDGLVAVIGINSNVQGTPLLLSVFEDGGQRKPVSGSSVAVPITGGRARQTFRKSVAPSLRINKLGLHRVGAVMEGNKRTVILPSKGKRIVFQRVGKGKHSDLVPLYVFERNVHLRKRMHFVRIATDLAEEQLPKLYARYLRLYIKA